MSKTKKSRKPWIVLGIVIIAGLIISGLSWANANNTSEAPEPTPTPTATKTEAQTIAENSVYIFMSAIMEDVAIQTSADASQQVRVETETGEEAADGTPAAVATVSLSELPEGVSVESNIAYLKNLIAEVNSNQGTSWALLEATDEFADEPNIVGAVKLWEDTDTPVNPAVVDVVYFNTDGVMTISVTATVYLGNNPTTNE